MVGRIGSNVSISIDSEVVQGAAKFYVSCLANDIDTAKEVYEIFAKHVGHMEPMNPVRIDGKFRIRFQCQLHRVEDLRIDATEGDRGNTVADGFIRVVHVASKLMPKATVDEKSARKSIEDYEFLIDEDGDEYPVKRLKKLKEYLSETADSNPVTKVDENLLSHKGEFVLSEKERQKKDAKGKVKKDTNGEPIPALVRGAYVPITKALEEDDKVIEGLLPKTEQVVDIPQETASVDTEEQAPKGDAPASGGSENVQVTSKKTRRVKLWAKILFPIGIVWFIINKILDYRDKNKVEN